VKLAEIPVVSTVVDAGADDRVFDSMLLVGPVVIAIIALLGRSVVTELLAVAYILTFVSYVVYRATAAEE
jgi:hypothetical protein